MSDAPGPVGNMKHGLTSSRPKLSILPRAALLHETRALEYGADFYARGNYHGAPPAGVTEEAAILGYLDACLRHVTKVADAVNKALGTGGDARAAIATVDDFAEGKPPSMLPELGHAMASLAIAIERAVAAGILPADPGQPWRKGAVTEERSPEAAARHERRSGEDLWYGYRRGDVIEACRSAFDAEGKAPFDYRFVGGLLYSGWGGLVDMENELNKELMRSVGLRRPDEPDYKPIKEGA